MRLPRVLLLATMGLFAVSAAGTLLGLGVFFWHDTDFWDVYDVDATLAVAAALLGGLTVSSGLLALHHAEDGEFVTFEGLLFVSVFVLSLLNLLWILPAVLFV